jgi:hypothetical protein
MGADCATRYFADDEDATQKLQELSVSAPKPEEDEVLRALSGPRPPRRCLRYPVSRPHPFSIFPGEEAPRWQDQEEGEAASSLDTIDEK